MGRACIGRGRWAAHALRMHAFQASTVIVQCIDHVSVRDWGALSLQASISNTKRGRTSPITLSKECEVVGSSVAVVFVYKAGRRRCASFVRGDSGGPSAAHSRSTGVHGASIACTPVPSTLTIDP